MGNTNHPDISDFIKDKQKTAHLIGIGGVSMCSLAETLLESGHKITGSDMQSSSATKSLSRQKVKIYVGHFAENVREADYIIRSAAIKDDNPEIVEAKKLGIPVFSRAEGWGAIMQRYKNAVCISGTHGKTTTTSMLTHIAMAASADPTVMIGGSLPLIGGGHRVGKGDTIILEACEYCNSFLNFFPTVAVIMNVECDHIDFFKDLDDVKHSFKEFALKTPADRGIVVINSDDPNTLDTVKDVDRKKITFGIDSKADVTAEKIRFNHGMGEFDLYFKGEKQAHIRLLVPGRHNILNALGAAAAALSVGFDPDSIERGLSSYGGVARRFEFKGQYSGAMVYDDYAHHPGELKVLFDMAESMGYERIICAFQPHTFTRTAAFFDDFVKQLSRPDILVLADIYAAREKNTTNITSRDLAAKIEGSYYMPDFDDMVEFLRKIARPGDLIITVGAGELDKVSARVVEDVPQRRHTTGFDYGVEVGGLRDIDDIKILVCYMLKTVGTPLRRSLIDEAIQTDGLASYWNLSQAISELIKTQAVTVGEEDGESSFALALKGREFAEMLETSLPFSVRERAVKQATALLSKARALKENEIGITKTDSGYEVSIIIKDGSLELMTVKFLVADAMQANIAKENFLKDPSELYKTVLEKLT